MKTIYNEALQAWYASDDGFAWHKITLGKNQANALSFAHRMPGLHSFAARSRPTHEAIHKLAEYGYIKVNEFDQFELA